VSRMPRDARILHPLARHAPSLALAAAMLGSSGRTACAQDSVAAGSVVHGVVMAREAGLPLAYSVVAVVGSGNERFTDERGRFTLVGLGPGKYRLRVKHLGFTPRELPFEIPVPDGDTLTVELSRVAVRLAAMHVRADVVCRYPGPPSVDSEPGFALLFEQVKQNAERLRLLAEVYPFVARLERVFTTRRRSGSEQLDAVDTTAYDSRQTWQYRRGQVISAPMVSGHVEYQLNIPTLREFAEEEFLRSHCFAFAGVEEVDGAPVFRVDFWADRRIRGPDVDGSFLVDTASYQVRRSEVRLTKPPPRFRDLVTVIAVTDFDEIAEGIPVIRSVQGVNRVRPRGRDPVTERAESQRLLALHFLGTAPLGVVRSP